MAREGKRAVLANGVFDILHPGHLDLLRFARSQGDWLIVALNSDSSVKANKGEGRPINDQESRKAALLATGLVDEVIIFDEPTTKDVTRRVRPQVIVKGAEWTAEELRKIDTVPDDIEIVMCPLTMKDEGSKYSTTDIINERKKDGTE